jgi:hypothetical protein
MYAPHAVGEVYLVCFDRHHRVALLRDADVVDSQWALPHESKERGESWERALHRLLGHFGAVSPLRLGASVGRIDRRGAATAGPPWSVRVFTVHVPDVLDLRRCGFGRDASAVLWVPYSKVGEFADDLGFASLGLFVVGYVEGWIPDGPITLE